MALADLPKLDPNSARIDGLIARAAPVAVLFRRGPSRRVRLLRWDLRRDTIEPGQWLKGRIYARRCDLSPDGSLLAYFAASFRPPYATWTAISRPPWLTALALWPKGDAWGGGGLFGSSRLFRLNHRLEPYESKPNPEIALAQGFALPRGFRVEPLHERAGWGEDHPIEPMRLSRDRWAWEQAASKEIETWGGRVWFRFVPPIARFRDLPSPHKGSLARLHVQLHAIKERQGRWSVETADVVGKDGRVLRELGRVDWADVGPDGEILYTAGGRVHRLTRPALDRSAPAELVADLNDMAFEPIASPPEARRWP